MSRIDDHAYACVYCGTVKISPNCTGTDVACCGEVGHVEKCEVEDDKPTEEKRAA